MMEKCGLVASRGRLGQIYLVLGDTFIAELNDRAIPVRGACVLRCADATGGDSL